MKTTHEKLTAAGYSDDDLARMVALRDSCVSTAKRIEDAIGELVQIHHVGPSGDREFVVQFPAVSGLVTDTLGLTEMANAYPLDSEQVKEGWRLEFLTEGAGNFVVTAAEGPE